MSQRTGRAVVVLVATLGFLHGCGGGGPDGGSAPSPVATNPPSGTSPNPPTPPTNPNPPTPPVNPDPPSPAAQAIAFADTGPVNKVFGDSDFTNVAAGGDGTGAVTYASGNAAVASVDPSTGTVTVVAAGTAQITATKAADSAYLSAQSSYTVNVSKASQALAFNDPGPLNKIVGHFNFIDTVSGGKGTGAISYTAADSTIAGVDAATGEVSLNGAGTTQITATKAGDSNYLVAQASYTLNVSSSSTGTITAWLGVTDTLVSFPPVAVGDQFVRSTAPSCDVTTPLACAMGHSDVVTAASIADSVAQLNRTGWYWLTLGANASQGVPVTPVRIPERTDRQVLNFNGKLWAIGGDLIDNDVRSSADGRAWTSSPSTQLFTPRSELQAISCNGQLWVIGGWGGPSKTYNDVWSSSDGINWTQVTPSAAFQARLRHQVVCLNGRMWLIGGQDATTLAYIPDVWSSTDGVTWTLVNPTTPFGQRQDPRAAAFNGRLWVIGGAGPNDIFYNDVWSSNDGVTWTSTIAPFSIRSSLGIASYANKLWVLGGRNANTLLSDVWSTTDGTSWTSVSTSTAYSARQGLAAAGFKNRLWIVGGDDDISIGCCDRSDVWSTVDGTNWTYESTQSSFQPTATQHALQLNNQFWIISGADPRFATQVWGSTDGDTWTQATAAAPMPTRYQYATASFGGRMWLVGGRTGFNVSTSVSDVWSSANGTDWTQNTAAAGFSPRFAHQVVGFQGRLRLIGGYNFAGQQGAADVWSSSDGVTWTQDVITAPFGGRIYHEVVEFNGALWLIGGGSTIGQTDVWSSNDGVTWTRATAAAEFGGRSFFQVIPANGQLWLVGGYAPNGTYLNDVWSSTDGAHWTQVTAAAAFVPRKQHSSGVFNGRLFIFGGSDGSSWEQPMNEIWSSTDGSAWRVRYQNQITLP
jgi:hypothetical protein